MNLDHVSKKAVGTAAEKSKQCAHPPCTCHAAAGSDYWSTQSEAMEKTPDIACRCEHAGCGGKTY
jgi:hypothetical protein